MAPPPEPQAGPERGNGRVVNEETALLSGEHPRNSAHEEDHQDEQEGWNDPPVNAYRYASVNLTLLIMGMNDACVGVSHH